MLSFDYSFGVLGWLVVIGLVGVLGIAAFWLATAVRGAQRIVAEQDEADGATGRDGAAPDA